MDNEKMVTLDLDDEWLGRRTIDLNDPTSIIKDQHMKICACFGEPRSLDRSKVIKPTRVEEVVLR